VPQSCQPNVVQSGPAGGRGHHADDSGDQGLGARDEGRRGQEGYGTTGQCDQGRKDEGRATRDKTTPGQWDQGTGEKRPVTGKGAAARATEERDDAVAELDAWTSRFRGIAKVATRSRPDLARKLGIWRFGRQAWSGRVWGWGSMGGWE
jgi:hypothetical protein